MNRIIDMVLQKTGLLFLLLLLPSSLRAQEPRVIIQTEPDRPFEGSTLTLTLLVAHGNPDEVNVMASPFSDLILLDYMLKGPRTVNNDAGNWTAIDFRFTLTGHGTITFDSFTVFTPKGQAKTDPFTITVQRPPGAAGSTGGGETARFRLSWENVPANLKIGEAAVVSLRVNGWKSSYVLPESGLFFPPVPLGHIIEPLPLSESEKSAGIALKLRVIPLQAGVLTIENRRLTIKNAIYDVPVLRIPVSRVPGKEP
jgi:hypothetical protein